eukprot:11228096-Lingulodinium_polyedra.AAC.1
MRSCRASAWASSIARCIRVWLSDSACRESASLLRTWSGTRPAAGSSSSEAQLAGDPHVGLSTSASLGSDS